MRLTFCYSQQIWSQDFFCRKMQTWIREIKESDAAFKGWGTGTRLFPLSKKRAKHIVWSVELVLIYRWCMLSVDEWQRRATACTTEESIRYDTVQPTSAQFQQDGSDFRGQSIPRSY